jgi:hypothetical protein
MRHSQSQPRSFNSNSGWPRAELLFVRASFLASDRTYGGLFGCKRTKCGCIHDRRDANAQWADALELPYATE